MPWVWGHHEDRCYRTDTPGPSRRTRGEKAGSCAGAVCIAVCVLLSTRQKRDFQKPVPLCKKDKSSRQSSHLARGLLTAPQ